jgi:hypothetical protein
MDDAPGEREPDAEIPVKDLGERADVDEIELEGSKLLDKVRELARDGTTRRLHIMNEEGRPLIDVPIPVGAVGLAAGVLLAPTLAAVGAVAALLTKVRVRIERDDPAGHDDTPD